MQAWIKAALVFDWREARLNLEGLTWVCWNLHWKVCPKKAFIIYTDAVSGSAVMHICIASKEVSSEDEIINKIKISLWLFLIKEVFMWEKENALKIGGSVWYCILT